MPKLPLPKGHHTVTPGFAVPNAAKVLAFLQKAFGAQLVERYDGPGGAIMHCEVMLGDSVVMFGEAMPSMGHDAMPASLSYYVDDGKAVDATYKKAIDAGATSVTAPKDQFYGYRSACVKDPGGNKWTICAVVEGGNKWTICAVVEQLTPEEIQKRMASMGKG